MFSWFDAGEAKKFGKELAELIVERSQGADKRKEKKAALGAEKLARDVSMRINAFRGGHRLNVYKKAQLGNELKWGLQQGGIAQDQIDGWTTFVLSRL
ncbi:MAG: hypothetical protein IT479_06850 [Xanthomonadales bacterium]|nr:hypothetical protein [Xanthomonadales bacterium]MCC6592979.1 hypothetical protein [Xanthomonadales bacterium]MCE7932892.1 hypothetical protein [Xanthomonadales bacterium PRO6]